MSHVPLWLRCVFAALLVGTMALAFWGRPPRHRPRPKVWRRLAAVGAGFYGAGCAALLAGEAVLSAGLVGVGVETLSVVAWLGRGLGGEDGEDGGGGGGGSDPDDHDRDGDGDGEGGPHVWRPSDERAFWDYVSRKRPHQPIPG
ncbi:MAG: hypothetical protein QOE65_1371 [Solirubrobacteraceae bacterium]|jgi:hypothetical protein|nr:hypothetical protein [Solirubrobacteraceae bacterium]